MTLTEFLRGRIEDAARAARAAYYDHPSQFTTCPALPLNMLPGLREILKVTESGDHSAWDGCRDECQDHALDWVVKQLALPWADHPDYREEWKP